ncbi:MAG: hypothetical protein JOZ77_08010 [Candidatus Eremiobacteraeota bacterium]|nr:hypothetical protein [Candidatus Eremiobacteraeota bacterium]
MTTVTSTIKAILFDIDSTLGEIDSPGHLTPYLPSTEQLLRATTEMGVILGVIMNLPDAVSDEKGRAMVTSAVLSQNERGTTTIGDFIKAQNIVTNHEATQALGRPTHLPDPELYRFAAKKLGIEPPQSLFVAADLNAVLGAVLAGMSSKRKECPPGRDFSPALVGPIGKSAVDSGRQFQAMLEHEHLLGERIFACGSAIAEQIGALVAGKEPALNQGRWISPAAVAWEVDGPLYRSMQYYIHLVNHFADQVHLRAEEAMIDVAVACGMDRKRAEWVINQHDQARAYWACLNIAWRRIVDGDDDDRFFALVDFKNTMQAFVYLFTAHAVRENFQMYTEAGNARDFSDSDDALVLNLLEHSGPSDITPYIGMVARMEKLLGIQLPT